ncbi:MAG: ABC transporter substrate-binding protein [Devosia sp.]
MKRCLLAALGLALLTSTAVQAQTKNPDTLVFLWTDDVQSFDPAYIGTTPSSYGPLNVYSRLLNYNGTQIAEFVPGLSTEVPTTDNGLIVESDDGSISYTFPIREGVFAHKVGLKGADGAITWKLYDELTEEEKATIEPGYGTITPEDVKYSLMRAMLQGESWMANAVTEMITAGKYTNVGAWGADLAGKETIDEVDEAGLVALYDALSAKIVVDGSNVTLKLDSSFPATLGVIALPFATSIVDKEWTVDHGGWPGTADTWKAFYKPAVGDGPLFADENGTGPFMLEEWDQAAKSITLKRFEGYWNGAPALERVVIRTVPEWTTRRLQLEAGDADVVATPIEFLDEMAKKEGIKVTDRLPQVFGRGLFFAWPLQATDNPAIGSGQLDGNGIPPDFFGDIDVRKGFNYAQDYNLLIEQVMLNKTVQMRGPTVRGLMGYREDSPVYSYDPAKATEHFQKAFGGELWEKGFTFTVFLAEGNSSSLAAVQVLQQNLARINPKFRLLVETQPISAVNDKIFGHETPILPLSYMGWGPDYSDPGGPLGAATYYLSSTGLVAGLVGQGYRDLMKADFDPLLAEAFGTADTAVRTPLYEKLQDMSYEYATTQFLWEEATYIVTRDNINGYVHNPVTYGAWDFSTVTKD